MTYNKKAVKVWDPVVRIGHWTIVIAFFTAYFTEEDLLTQHVWAGYILAAVVLIRLTWGFIGSRYARFRGFVYSPAKIIGYLKNLLTFKPQHYVGHNPAGGAMVIALLFCLIGTTVTGLKLYAVEENAGPLALSKEEIREKLKPVNLISDAKAEKDDDEGKNETEIKTPEDKKYGHEVDEQAEEFWEELHEAFANMTLLLVFLHVMGVVASSIIDKENLVKAMFSGKKEIDDTYQ